VLAAGANPACSQNKFSGAMRGLSKGGKMSDRRKVQSQMRVPAFRRLIRSGLVTKWGAGVS
jgi:hypothetical protein